MKPLNPLPPFVWPEPRVLVEMCTYENQPPFSELAEKAHFLFGIVSALTIQGIDVLKTWMESNKDLKVSLIVMVYPTCATKQEDLSRLLELTERTSPRLSVHVCPLEWVTDRASNTLCCLAPDKDVVHIFTGSSEDFGLAPKNNGHINFVFRGAPVLVEGFKRYFDLLWANSREITAKGVAQIPDLVLPQGSEEGVRLWRDYMDACAGPEASGDTRGEVDPDTGDVKIKDKDGKDITPPTEDGGLKKLDPLAEFVARLYEKGSLISVDKLSRIPPLDAPLDPNVFGDVSELQKGNVTRKVSMRVSIIDEKTLKEIDKRRQGLRTLLTKFTFGLADNMRWMPETARVLFESELKRINEEGQKLISVLLEGGVEKFIDAKRPALVKDINAMYAELGRSGQVTDDVIVRVIENLKERLGKAQSANFMPKLSYSVVSFASTDNAMVSPWGQAFSMLADVAAFPRKALTDSFFFRGLNVHEDILIEAMNVADDALCRDLRTRSIKDRCREELDLLSRIEKAPLESRDRCELVRRILAGDSIKLIDEELIKKEST
ncbi:MAG: hypothetical protein KJ936_08400 [Proteobacteria bacterium]|nr:hypothetical protein [Pseudomonadota bacterium]MBU2227671.1 hypothetical protein [Pseudomonadota bacterium]